MFTDLLIYSEPDLTAKLTQPRRHDLSNILVVDVPDNEEMQNAFQISSLQKSFIVYASNTKEKYEWIKMLNRYASCATESSDDSKRAPVWIPDKNHEECMACRVKFSLINRRHRKKILLLFFLQVFSLFFFQTAESVASLFVALVPSTSRSLSTLERSQ